MSHGFVPGKSGAACEDNEGLPRGLRNSGEMRCRNDGWDQGGGGWVGLHQGSALSSSFLFAIVMEMLTDGRRDDDDETMREQVHTRLCC